MLNVIATVGQQRLRSIQRRSLTAALRRSLVRRLHQLTFVFHDRSQAGVLQNKFILDLNRLEDVHNYLAENIIMQGTTDVYKRQGLVRIVAQPFGGSAVDLPAQQVIGIGIGEELLELSGVRG